MSEITTILHRRNDLSTFVVHLTKAGVDASALENLARIFEGRQLEAPTVLGWAKGYAGTDDPGDQQRQSQRVACFSETPLEHIHLLAGPITLWGQERRAALEPFGFAFTKVVARRLGLNPVFYIDLNGGFQSPLGAAFDELRAQALRAPDFHAHPAAQILPFIEGMGRWDHRNTIKEFWWEREWRHRGPLLLPAADIIWVCPEGRINELQERVQREVAPWIDPQWGLERIIAHLAGIQPQNVSPFEPPRVPADPLFPLLAAVHPR